MDEPAHAPERTPRHPHVDTEPAEPLVGDEPAKAAVDCDLDVELDPGLDSHVRSLLAGAPDPGPMPAAVSDRISAALAEEVRLRVEPGPLAGAGHEGGGLGEGTYAAGAVRRLPSRSGRPGRPRPVYLVAAVAAATVVVAAGASVLHVTKRPNGAAAMGGSYSSPAPPSASPPQVAGTGSPHVQLSRTAYTAGDLAARARTLLDHPGPPIRDLAAESPAIGPIATPIGLESCLEAVGAVDATHPAPDAVSVDLATFDGRPAAVLVVTRAGASTAWVVERSCTTGSPGVLAGATPVP